MTRCGDQASADDHAGQAGRPIEWGSAADEPFCYLTTIGRISGRPHTVEIWFASRGGTIYLLSGRVEGSDWARNVNRQPRVALRIGSMELVDLTPG